MFETATEKLSRRRVLSAIAVVAMAPALATVPAFAEGNDSGHDSGGHDNSGHDNSGHDNSGHDNDGHDNDGPDAGTHDAGTHDDGTQDDNGQHDSKGVIIPPAPSPSGQGTNGN